MNEFIVQDDDYWFEEFAENVDAGESLNCGGGGGGGGGIVKQQNDNISKGKNRREKVNGNGNVRNRHNQYATGNMISGSGGVSSKKSGDVSTGVINGNSVPVEVSNYVSVPVTAPTPDFSATAGLSEDKPTVRGSFMTLIRGNRNLYGGNGTSGSSAIARVSKNSVKSDSDSESFGIISTGGTDIEAFKLYGEDDNSWCSGSRLGSNWHVSDKGGYWLYKSGTLSWSTEGKGSCDLSDLAIGKTYSWRVTGAMNPKAKDVSYEFCGVRGGASSEVVFQIDCDGECVPLSYNVPCGEDYEYGYQLQESSVTLQGSIYLEGVEVSELSAKDLGIIRASLSHEFNEITDHESSAEDIVQIQAHKVVPVAPAPPDSRRLEGQTAHQVDFTVKVFANHYGVDVANDVAVSKLPARLSSFLDHSMHSGLFKSKVVSRAMTDGSEGLQSVKHTRLVESMSVVTHKSHVEAAMSVFADGVVVAGAVVGIVCGILFALSLMRTSVSKVPPKVSNAGEVILKQESKISSIPGVLHRPAIHESLMTAFENNPVDQEIAACAI